MLTQRFDIRAVISTGLVLTAASCLMRVFYNDQITFWQLMWPQLVFGAGLVMTMVPLVELSTASLPDEDIANGSGQFNFLRSLSSAVATAVVVALWSNLAKQNKAELVGAMQHTDALMYAARAMGIDDAHLRNGLDLVTQAQAVMQATNDAFLLLGIVSLGAAALVWLAPKPKKQTGKRKVMAH
jgi:DHA2 family multidrug resistance protein